MLLTLVLASTLMQGAQSGSSTLTTRAVEAIDKNYLYAKEDSWQRLRTSLLADNNVTVSSLDRQLLTLHDGDLRIVTSTQMKTMQAESAGRERGIGLSGAKLALLGCGLGVIGSLAVSRMLSAFLFGISSTDPLIYAGSVALMGYWGAMEQKTRLRIQATSSVQSDWLRSGRNSPR
jgi:hypothetical protein